jgi:tetratricopeptide (TPR) repeat protein
MRGALSLLLALGALAHAAPPEPTSESTQRAKREYRRAILRYSAGDYRGALDAFREAFADRPDGVFLFNMGQCYRLLGDPDNAARSYRDYLRLEPRAANRQEVEAFIDAADHEIAERSKQAQPAKPPEAAPPPVAPPPRVAQPVAPPVVAPPSTPAPRPRRRWPWVLLGVTAALVVGAAVAVALVLLLPGDAPVHAGTDPTVSIP